MSFFSSKKNFEENFEGTQMSAPRCYMSHVGLKIGKGMLFGGNASFPQVRDADVYVSLQSGSASGLASDPWAELHVLEICYWITDRQAPTNVPRFKKMIDWLCSQLQDGKRVHVGCIGGHGRTGTVLSAIVVQLMGEKDAIQWVRKQYCDRAVETSAQIQFLVKHYGVSKVEGSKDFVSYAESPIYDGRSGVVPYRDWDKKEMGSPRLVSRPELPVRKLLPQGASEDTRAFVPMSSSTRCVWKRRKSGH